MTQKVNEVYEPLFTQHPRYFILMGGRGAGRSTVASQFANAKLVAPEYFRCAIMRYIFGDIRNSIYQEILDRAEENDILGKLKINESMMHIEYGANSVHAVGFHKSSGDQKAKLKSLASYNYIIIEEADEVREEDFMQLDDSIRTVKGDISIILLLNPPAKNHWIIRRWFDLIPSETPGFFVPKLKPEAKNTVAIITDYHVNEINIARDSIESYEKYRETKPSHYWNMIKGYVPETVQGRIYNFVEIESVPPEARLKRRGLDYSYSNDPTALVDVYVWNNAFIWDEVVYKKGMSNRDIADVIRMQPDDVLTVADSAEPKSNDELTSYGIAVLPSHKGPGSVNQGIQYVQGQTVYYTKRSIHIKEEQENYAWRIDKDTGESINTPIDMYNHAMDAGRYAMESLDTRDEIVTLPDDTEWIQDL